MTQHEFLTAVLPPPTPDETYFAVGLCKGQPPDVKACPDVDSLIARGDIHVRFGLNSYMALGSFGIEGGRTAANAKRFKAFWIDLDVGKPQNSYPTVEDAGRALLQFAGRTDMSPSIVVSSGKGLHAYWVLEEALPISYWQPIAGWFKSLCMEQGLIIDPACTADAARILRMPGTIHMGTGTEVMVLTDTGFRWTPAFFLGCIQQHLKNEQPPMQAPTAAAPKSDSMMTQFGMGPEPPKAHAERIARNCPQVLCMGHAPEPVWYLAMNVLKRCKDGREWAHKLSALDTARYTEAGTDAKFDRAKPDSPTLCATFETQRPDYCRQCKYYGRLKSPIELDRYADVPQATVPAAPQPTAPVQAGVLTIPDEFINERVPFHKMPNNSFYVDSKGIHYVTAQKGKDGNAKIIDTIICRTQLYFKRTEFIYDDKEWQTDYVFDAIYPDGAGERELHMLVAAYHAAPIKWFADHMIQATTVKNQASLMAFTNAYLEQVIHRAQIRHKYSHYGWAEVKDEAGGKQMGYVTEGCIITADGAKPVSFDRPASDPTRQVFTRSGTLDGWKTVPKIYRILKQPLGQLAMCFSFAAPLMKYGSGEAKNCFLNIYSREGGRGKSHVLRMAASVWGNPAKAFFQKDSSVVAREKRMALWHNMPAMMDEVSHLSDEDMSNLVFAVIGGDEKQKLTVGSEFRVTGDWSTATLATSNRPVKEFVARRFKDSDAGQLRVMDYECDFQTLDPSGVEMQCLNQCVHLANLNYGLAGPEFIFQLLRRPERLHTLEASIAAWVAQHDFIPKERFYSYPLGLALQAGRWAVEFGLLDYDMDALENWVFTTFLPAIRDADLFVDHSARAVLVEYINDRILQHALIVKRAERTSKEVEQTDSTVPDTYIAKRPLRTLTMRFELENQVLYFSRQDFDKYCSMLGWSMRTALRELKRDGLITESNIRMSLGRYIGWLPNDRTYCIMLDATALKACGIDQDIQEA